jgi:hypothetical protein
MKKRIQKPLDADIDFSQPELNPDDLLEPLPDDYYDTKPNEAKRRRVEKVAMDYIRRGQPPVLLSSRLRGPFDGKWANPWTVEVKENTSAKQGEHEKEKRCRLETISKPSVTTTRRASKNTATTPQVSQIEQFPRTKKRSPINSEKGSQRSVGKPWLRRRESDVGRRFSAGIAQAGSPAPPRDEDTVIYAPVQHGQWQSSASASMAISSPANQPLFRALETPKGKPNVDNTLPSAQSAQHAWRRESMQEENTRIVRVHGKECSGGHESVDIENHDTAVETNTQGGDGVHGATSSSPVKKHKEKIATGIKKNRRGEARKETEHNPPQASPLPSSFQYTRLRRPAKNGQNFRPRPMTFDSPLVVDDIAPVAVEIEEREPPEQIAGVQDVSGDGPSRQDVDKSSEDEGAMPEGPRGEDKVESQTSIYSTQAAMRLAQLEFQEGSFLSPLSSYASDTPRSGELRHSEQFRQSHSQPNPGTDTPRGNMREGSPAITPFHTFNAKLDKNDAERDPASVPISTQDLFLAASPFAFSTVKKKPAAPPKRSSLRFAVLSQEEERGGLATSERAKSPTPFSDRIPLKIRNSMVSFKIASPKGSQESWRQAPSRPRTSELPLLDYAPSTGDMSFADQFLRNLDDFT